MKKTVISQKSLVTSHGGYTLIELTIASALFGFMLIAILAGFIAVVRINQNGQASRATQQNARFVMEEIVRVARTATDAQINGQSLCLTTPGSKVKYFVGTRDGYVRLFKMEMPESGDCAGFSGHSINPITANGVVAQSFYVSYVNQKPPSIEIRLTLSTRSANSSGQCDSNTGSFCSVTTLKSVASLRGQR